jgi:hypothetical protein
MLGGVTYRGTGKTVALETNLDMVVDLIWISWLVAKGTKAFKLSWWCGMTWIERYLLTTHAPAPAQGQRVSVCSSCRRTGCF